jgi:hypothetical protein
MAEDNNKTRAITLAQAAYEELKAAGIPEQFLPLLQSIAAEHRAVFFAHFGDEMAVCLEVSPASGPFDIVNLSVEVAMNKPSWRNRLHRAWLSLLGRSITFQIRLNAQQVEKLKDLLWVLG